MVHWNQKGHKKIECKYIKRYKIHNNTEDKHIELTVYTA